MLALRIVLKTIDRAGAVEFARKYSNGGTYPSPFITYTADCTNFISICIHKGGKIPMDLSGEYNHTWFFKSSSNKTSSWTGAQAFRQYIYCNNNSTSKNIGIYGTHTTINGVTIGDIVSFSSSTEKWTDGRLKSTHSAIISKAIPKYNDSGMITGQTLYVCQHSYTGIGYKDVPLSKFSSYNGSGQKMYLHFVKYYK